MTSEYTLFSSLYRILKMIDHILAHKTHINEFKGIEIIQNMFSDHRGITLEINKKER